MYLHIIYVQLVFPLFIYFFICDYSFLSVSVYVTLFFITFLIILNVFIPFKTNLILAGLMRTISLPKKKSRVNQK